MSEELVEELTTAMLLKEVETLVIAGDVGEGLGVEVLIETTTDGELNAGVEDINDSDEPQTFTSHDTVCCIIDSPESEVAKFRTGIVGHIDADMVTIASKQCACSGLETRSQGRGRGTCQTYLLKRNHFHSSRTRVDYTFFCVHIPRHVLD